MKKITEALEGGRTWPPERGWRSELLFQSHPAGKGHQEYGGHLGCFSSPKGMVWLPSSVSVVITVDSLGGILSLRSFERQNPKERPVFQSVVQRQKA